MGLKKRILVTYVFRTRRGEKIVTGELWFQSTRQHGIRIHSYFVGGFLSDNELQFIYANKNEEIQGWGSIHFSFAPNGKVLTGDILGVSSQDLKHFHSLITLQKGPNFNLAKLRTEKPEVVKPKIFIGHGGKSTAWLELRERLIKSGCIVETFESQPRIGKGIFDVISRMTTDNSIGIFIMSPENEMADGSWRCRQNVVHEIGYFQAVHSADRALILLETGVEGFSNVGGIARIEFDSGNIKAKFKEIEASIQQKFPNYKKARPLRRA